ncbi:MAG: efflux RND transporter periplasmic adaptor subunit [Acidobacteria bacterium]|nr:efflux RND transporter periplasmic adaptor subunit [Acidobacteriota bacterium]
MPHFKRTLTWWALGALLLATGCNRQSPPPGGAAGGGRGGPGEGPPAAVALLTLQEKPIEQTSDFISSLRSLHATTIQPEVDGFITRIFVKAGDAVRPGAALVQINPEKQQAAVRSTEATRGGVQADVQYWRQQVTRLESLVQAGAISRQEFEQAQTSLRTAEARLAAVNAQVSEGRVELRYYRVNAPQAGVVGDIPVRVGDRVTPDTVITTIDDNSALEAYIQVPIDRSPELRVGLPVQLLDAAGKPVATNAITFVAPRVDDATQTVLVKSLLRESPPSVRAQQFARARIVWRNAPGLTVPLTAVLRVNGQYFCFVAEQGEGGLVARQRPLELGDMIGNDYIVKSGVKAGDRIVTSGIQKLGNGAPVKPE